MKWVISALLAGIGWAVVNLLVKFAKVDSITLSWAEYIIPVIVLAPFSDLKAAQLSWKVLAAIGALTTIATVLGVEAIQAAPNPGYAIAIMNLQAIFLLVLSYIFLGARVDLLKAVGVILTVTGAVLLSI